MKKAPYFHVVILCSEFRQYVCLVILSSYIKICNIQFILLYLLDIYHCVLSVHLIFICLFILAYNVFFPSSSSSFSWNCLILKFSFVCELIFSVEFNMSGAPTLCSEACMCWYGSGVEAPESSYTSIINSISHK